MRVDRFAVGLYCVSVLDAREEINSIISKRGSTENKKLYAVGMRQDRTSNVVLDDTNLHGVAHTN